MNTHGNGDHWYGNQLLPDGIPIVATRAAVEDMRAAPPGLLHALSTRSRTIARSSKRFSPAHFAALISRASSRGCPAETFEGRHRALGRRAHCRADRARPGPHPGRRDRPRPGSRGGVHRRPAVHRGHPGHVGRARCPTGWRPASRSSGWGQRARSRARPSHRRLRRARRPALPGVRARRRPELGSRPAWTRAAAADDIDISDFADWGDPERIAVNVATIYRELDPTLPPPSPPELFVRMAEWSARHGSGRPPSRRP